MYSYKFSFFSIATVLDSVAKQLSYTIKHCSYMLLITLEEFQDLAAAQLK